MVLRKQIGTDSVNSTLWRSTASVGNHLRCRCASWTRCWYGSLLRTDIEFLRSRRRLDVGRCAADVLLSSRNGCMCVYAEREGDARREYGRPTTDVVESCGRWMKANRRVGRAETGRSTARLSSRRDRTTESSVRPVMAAYPPVDRPSDCPTLPPRR